MHLQHIGHGIVVRRLHSRAELHAVLVYHDSVSHNTHANVDALAQALHVARKEAPSWAAGQSQFMWGPNIDTQGM